MLLIVGLGNPGKKYEGTRHNMGFSTIDLLADLAQIDVDKEVFDGLLGRGVIFKEDVMLFKPTTYMNLSGTAVRQVVNYFKIDLQDIIVICDDMAINVGRIRLRTKGSSGGQKGLQNIIDKQMFLEEVNVTNRVHMMLDRIDKERNMDIIEQELNEKVKVSYKLLSLIVI